MFRGGEFHLQGQREMASGFLLYPDNSFEFFFSYGALDRQAYGQWKQIDNTVLLQTSKAPLSDFELVESSHPGNYEGILIKLPAAAPMLLAYLQCSLEDGKENSWKPFSQKGYLHFAPQPFARITLLFEFCPERLSVIQVPNTEDTHFTLQVTPTLTNVYFDRLLLHIGDDQLVGSHPLLDGTTHRYVRNS